MKHYLHIDEKGRPGDDLRWWCDCGIEGEAPTEIACEISFERHLMKEAFRRKEG